MIFSGLASVAKFTRGPNGRHCRLEGSSLPKFSLCCLVSATAHGRMSSGFKSVAILVLYGLYLIAQRPERSGLPSFVLGAGAARFGLPSGSRGMPGVG